MSRKFFVISLLFMLSFVFLVGFSNRKTDLYENMVNASVLVYSNEGGGSGVIIVSSCRLGFRQPTLQQNPALITDFVFVMLLLHYFSCGYKLFLTFSSSSLSTITFMFPTTMVTTDYTTALVAFLLILFV